MRANLALARVLMAFMALLFAAGRTAPAFGQPMQQREDEAKAAFDQERYGQAMNLFRSILAERPDDRTATVLLSFALARLGDTRGAVAQTRRALQLFPPDVKLHLLLAGLLSRDEATRNEAIQLYQGVLRRDPNNRLAALGMAELARSQGRTLDAIHDFVVLAERYPSDPRYPVRVGQLYGALGDLAQARHYFEQAYALDPRNVDAIRSLAILSDVEDRPDEMLRFYRELLSLFPTDVSAQIAVRNAETRRAEPELPISVTEMEKIPLDRYLEAVPKNSKQLRYRKEQMDATRSRSLTRFLPSSFFVAPSASTTWRTPKPALTDHSEALSFSFGWNLADIFSDPYKINLTGMQADFEAVRANLLSDVTATYYQRLQNIVQYRQLQRALALEPQNDQIRQNKQILKYTILNLTERLRIISGLP